MKVEECRDKARWDECVLVLGGHPLQLWGWGEVKSAHGWQVKRLLVSTDDGVKLAAQVLVRRLPTPFRPIAYIPRGPVAETFHVKSDAMNALTFHVKKTIRPTLLKIEPDTVDTAVSGGWHISRQSIQAARTIQLDLRKSEDELLAAMSKKTRQYIRKASKDVAIVELDPIANFDDVMRIYTETSRRAQFPLHKPEYYLSVAKDMGKANKLYGAKIGDELVSFLWLCKSDTTAFELYGGMTTKGQETRANYALKWHAIQDMKNMNVFMYDFGGLIATGVSTFKKGWADEETTLVGAIDYPMSSLYVVWEHLFPALKKINRLIKKLAPKRS